METQDVNLKPRDPEYFYRVSEFVTTFGGDEAETEPLEIEKDFKDALIGIKKLPKDAKFGVYTAYIYYLSLLKKLKRTPAEEIIKTRIRISNTFKILLLIKSFVTYKAKLI